MARPSTVVSRIMVALEDFFDKRNPIPSTCENKVNVLALCRELTNVTEADAQHFHKKDEIKAFVNARAIEQGLLPIGHRALIDDADIELEQRIRQTSAQAKQDAQAAVEATAAQHSLLEELKVVRFDLSNKILEIAALKERLRLIEEAGLFLGA
jgi:hypothetical protein